MSTVWEKKLATLFHRFDKEKKGYLTKEDIRLQTEAFITLGSLTDEEQNEIKLTYDKLWETFLHGKGEVKIDEWIRGHRRLVESEDSGKGIWEENLKKAGSLMFRAADKERRGAISAEEFATYLTCLGVDSAKWAPQIFAKLDESGKGMMQEADFLRAFHDFNYNNNDTPSKELMGPLVL